MSHRSTLKRRRERKRRRKQQQERVLQVRKVSTADLFAEIERRAHILAEVFGEQEKPNGA
jgi:hypothetical protein